LECKYSSTVNISESFFDTDIQSKTSTVETKSAPVNVPTLSSSIPSGFFDDPIQDLTARGLTMKQQIALQDEIEKKELNALIAELGEINEDTTAIDAELESEFNERDYDEAAIQMAYITILAKLYKQSDSVVSSSNVDMKSNENFDSELNAADTESKELLHSSTSLMNNSNNRSDPLQELVNQKFTEQQSKKRKLVVSEDVIMEDQQDSDSSDDESYDPLAFI